MIVLEFVVVKQANPLFLSYTHTFSAEDRNSMESSFAHRRCTQRRGNNSKLRAPISRGKLSFASGRQEILGCARASSLRVYHNVLCPRYIYAFSLTLTSVLLTCVLRECNLGKVFFFLLDCGFKLACRDGMSSSF